MARLLQESGDELLLEDGDFLLLEGPDVGPTTGTFTPPSTLAIPPTFPNGHGPAHNLFRHFRARPEGVNVFILSDDTVTEDEPDGQSVVWSPGDRNGEAVGAKWVKRAFYGGSENIAITDEEATLLTDAGYSVG